MLLGPLKNSPRPPRPGLALAYVSSLSLRACSARPNPDRGAARQFVVAPRIACGYPDFSTQSLIECLRRKTCAWLRRPLDEREPAGAFVPQKIFAGVDGGHPCKLSRRSAVL